MLEARLAAISVQDGDGHLRDLEDAMQEARLDFHQRRRILIRAWEAAVEGALEDGLLSLDEENALAKYAAHFGLEQHDLDGNGVQTSLVQAEVIRDVTRGVVPQRQRVNGAVPFNLMKSEQLVWVIQGVDYLETVVRRERRGTSHGVSIRVARGLYYSPRQFRSRPIEWEETVHADTGLLGLTTKHIYFAGSEEEVPGPVRQDRELRALRGRVRASFGTPRPRSPRPSGPATAGSPTTSPPTWPSSRAEPGHTSAAGDPTTGARWLRKQQGNLASTVTPNLQTCLSRAVKPGNPTPGNGLFPISL